MPRGHVLSYRPSPGQCRDIIDLGEPPSLFIDIKEFLLLPVESSSTLTKKSHYIIVFIKEAEPQKKINSNIGE